MPVQLHGSLAAALQSTVWDISVEGTKVTRTFEGIDFATMFAAQPPIGAVYSDLPITLHIQRVLIEPLSPGKARMTVELAENPNDSGLTGTLTDDITYQVTWQRVDKDLRQHPIYDDGGDKELTDEDRNKLIAWENDTNSETRQTKYDDLSTNALHLADRLKKGQDAYAVYIPVVRETKRYKGGKPVTGGCGKPDNPPNNAHAPSSSGNGTSYHYIITAEDDTREGRIWTKTTEWTGFEQIDTDIIEAT